MTFLDQVVKLVSVFSDKVQSIIAQIILHFTGNAPSDLTVAAVFYFMVGVCLYIAWQAVKPVPTDYRYHLRK